VQQSQRKTSEVPDKNLKKQKSIKAPTILKKDPKKKKEVADIIKKIKPVSVKSKSNGVQLPSLPPLTSLRRSVRKVTPKVQFY